ncbi:MAG: valine--tRNA ligase [Flavobacteriaceae bacterium]|nr:valine--tRNA ligase [Flavobacteriaceae bacterium]
MNIPSKFDASKFEKKWYQYYLDHHLFDSDVDKNKKAYTIVIPPPNVTGVLHMGHMLNNTLQDILIRRARLLGYNACWTPGTDHASIATEAKVVQWLEDKGIKKSSLTREEFVDYAWQWTNKYGGQILNQLQKIGCSCDWRRTKFTLDESMSESVIDVFIDLYNKGFIYKGYRMVHWDPQAQTTLSDEEVNHQEINGKLYYVNYAIKDTVEHLTIATTRPETILGDTAICVHPEDQRYISLIGKTAIVPIAKREIPIISDAYVDKAFGTGCLKVTPAHDSNDKELGEKHQLEFIDIFNSDGTLNEFGLHYKDQDRFVVREKIAEELSVLGSLQKIENYKTNVGRSERTNAIIEPRLSEQWFLKMEELAKPALKAVVDNEIKLYPKKFLNTYKHWMENIKDWNISRQLWWGHQIPVYYYGKNKEDYVIAKTKEKALEKAREISQNPDLKITDLRQDADVLDTWFSSWLWPISVFDGIRYPNNSEINYYYPTKDLVTGPDILFFWVARMIVSGYEFRNEKPFENIFLTGLVRDHLGRKMAKQLGNSPDPIELIQTYGADGVRVGLMLSTSAGNDLLFDTKLCQQGKNFANKIWNAFRLIKSWPIDSELSPRDAQIQGLRWFDHRLSQAVETMDQFFNRYRISDALMCLYKLVWEDFCSWLLEIVKPTYGQPISINVYDQVIEDFEKLMVLLHPFMPFITEEINHHLKENAKPLIHAKWPKSQQYNSEVLELFGFVKQLVTGFRHFRKQNQIPFVKPLKVYQIQPSFNEKEPFDYLTFFSACIEKIEHLKMIVGEPPTNQGKTMSIETHRFFIPIESKKKITKKRLIGDSIDEVCQYLSDLKTQVSSEKDKTQLEKMNNEFLRLNHFLESINKKLNNPNFINKAPSQIIQKEKNKVADTKVKIQQLILDIRNF